MTVTLAQLKTAQGITGTDNDIALEAALAQAKALVAAYVGYDLSDTTTIHEYTYTADPDRRESHRSFVHLPYWPVLEMIEVVNGDDVILDPSNYRVIKDHGRVDFYNGLPGGTNEYLTFHYRAGYDPLPAEIDTIVLNIAGGIYGNGGIGSQTNALKSLTMFDAMSMSFETGNMAETTGPAGFLQPWAFVLNKYRVVGQPVLK